MNDFEVTAMHIMAEIAIIFGICLLSEGIAALLPFVFPASVISMLILAALLLTGAVKTKHIQLLSGFFIANMGMFFIPSLVGTLEYAETLRAQFIPFLVITLLTTPVVYLVTAWTVQLLTRLLSKKGGSRHD